MLAARIRGGGFPLPPLPTLPRGESARPPCDRPPHSLPTTTLAPPPLFRRPRLHLSWPGQGSYDAYLDQDDWYAQSLAAERERLLEADRRKAREREEATREAEAAREAAAARAAAARAAAAEKEGEKVEAEVAEAAERAAEEEEAQAVRVAAATAAAEAEAARAAPAVAADDAQSVERRQDAKPPASAASVRLDLVTTPAAASGGGNATDGDGAAGVREDTMWTSDLEAKVRRQTVLAFDNLPPQESGQLLAALVGAASRGVGDAERSLRKLAALTRQAEAAELAGGAGGTDAALAIDELRALRAQIRSWAKDGERYVAGSWLNVLDELSDGI